MELLYRGKAVKNTKLNNAKDTFMGQILKFKSRITFISLTKFIKTYNYEPLSILVRVFEIRNQCVPLFYNYLIDVMYLQNFICRFIRKYSYLESKIHYDKLKEEVKAYNGPIQLIHETFGDVIRSNRPRMDSSPKKLICSLC
jgi:hypothetical protein